MLEGRRYRPGRWLTEQSGNMVYTPSTLHCDTPLREVAMPWMETKPMNERLKFVQDALSDRFTMAEVCARYGVSRPTGYKWIARHAE